MSRKRFFKNLDFSKMWDPEICQSAREGQKWRPVYYYTPPLAPRRFLQKGRRARAISQSVSRNLAECSARPRFPFRRPKGGASVVVYIPNGSKWNHRNFVGIFEKNHQVDYRCLAESPAGARFASTFGEFWILFCSSICSSIWSRIRATFGAALALCEICVSWIAHFQQFG